MTARASSPDRVVLVLGPDEEVRTVREVYDWVIKENKDFEAIARLLNGRGIENEFGRPWTRFMVQQIVTNPKYVGANVTNRTSEEIRREVDQEPPGDVGAARRCFPGDH